MTVSLSNPRAKQRWGLLAGGVAAMLLLVAGLTLGFTQSNWELDKNANHDLTSTHLGGLKGSVNSSSTSITVCELQTAPLPPFTIQIDAERMTVTGVAASVGTTGGCAFANPADIPIDSRVWTVTRGVAGTTAAAHVGTTPRNDVTGINLNGAPTGHDWDQVYSAFVANGNSSVGMDCGGIGASACIFKTRPNSGTASSSNDFTGPTTFTGTSGDTQPISAWTWTNQSVPDADEINNAYAAKYSTSTPDLYLGMDRYAVNGSKDIGFWFFHQAVTPLDGGGFSGAHCYAGQTTDGCPGATSGDLLILTTFSAGGGTTTARAYEWVGNGPGRATSSDGPLNFLGSFGDCVPGNPNDHGCATTANSTVPAPWASLVAEKPTGASPGNFYAGGFMEAGLDLAALGETGCFASFMGTSRSSPSLTAQPKAFIGGGFENCTSGMETTPSVGQGGTSAIGSDGTLTVHDSATIEVGGASSWSGTLKFYLCGPLTDTSETCDGTTNAGTLFDTQSIDQSTTQPIDSIDQTITEAGYYCFRGEFHSNTSSIPDAMDASANECFTVTPLTPTIDTKLKLASDDSDLVNPISIGTQVYDTATLSGGTSNAGGTVTYKIYTDNQCTTLSTDPALDDTVDVTSGSVGDSSTVTFNHAGTYYFQATYNDDANNVGGAQSSCTSETVVVSPNTPTIDTKLKLASDDSDLVNPIAIGTQVYDTATLSGATADAGGTVTYKIYTDDKCTVLSTDPSLNETVGVTNALVDDSSTVTFTQAGTYYFQATYNDDADNTGGAKSPCTSETVVVSPNSPAPHSTPVVQIKDTITVTGFTSDASGTVTVRLFSDNLCQTQVGSDQTFAVSGSTFSHETTWTVVTDGTYYYQVSYDGDNNNNSFTSACTDESVAVDITSLP